MADLSNAFSGIPKLYVQAGATANLVVGTTALATTTWYAYRFTINAAYTQVDMYQRNLTANTAETHEATFTGSAGTTLPATSVGMGLILDLLLFSGSASRTALLDGFAYNYLLTNRR